MAKFELSIRPASPKRRLSCPVVSTMHAHRPSPTTAAQDEKPWKCHPDFIPTLQRLQTRLYPLVSSTTGLSHPEFPTSLLAYNLLTSRQLDDLAIHYHQVWPPVAATSYYPVVISPWVGAACERDVDLETKRRRFGHFIGMQRCESPTEEKE